MTTTTASIELAIPDGLERSVAQLYQYKPGAVITFTDGEVITVDTEYVSPITGHLIARQRDHVLGIDMRRVLTIEAPLGPSEQLLARLIDSGVTSADLSAA